MSDDASEVSEYVRYSLTESSEPIGLWERALVVDPENGTVQRALDQLSGSIAEVERGGIAAWPTVAAPPAVEIGAVVRVDGLATRPELNGSCGTVRSFDAEAGR